MLWDYGFEYVNLATKKRFQDIQFLPGNEIIQHFQTWGDNGWELVNVIPSSNWHTGDIGEEVTLSVVAFFKRARV